MSNKLMKRRKFLMASSASAGVAALSGCTSLAGLDETGEESQEAGQVENPDDLPEVEMTHAHVGPPDATLRSQRVSLTLKNYMEEATAGKFTVNIAPAGEVGGTNEIAEQIQNGTIESGQLTGAHLAPFYPNFNCYAGAYMFRDVDIGLAVMDGPFGDKLRQGFLDETGARIYGWFDTGGFQSFSNSVRPLESVEDFEGLSVRTMSMGAHQEICRILGMSPEPFDITQLYEALDQGVYDAQKNAVETVILFGFNEVQDYITFDEHQLSFVWLHQNNDWYQELHPTYQRLLDEAGYRASMAGRQVTRFFRNYGREWVAENGMEVYEPPESLIDDLREKTQEPLNEFIRDEIDNPGLLDDIYEAIDETEEALGYGRF